ncbi:hypothetical protein AX14_004399 [Amanita brunnescens Koide BX004]|nr:hypothetical protein AX14_004399 [Amanita brunnescens Koide BX004]
MHSKKKAKSATKGKAGAATSNKVQDDADFATLSARSSSAVAYGEGQMTSEQSQMFNQQLPMSNQQFLTSDQQLPTSSQQLLTSNQQLPTSNQQLPTSQQLPMSQAAPDVPAAPNIQPAALDVQPAAPDVRSAALDVQPAAPDVQPAAPDQLPMSNQQLPTSNQQLPLSNQQLPPSNQQLPTSGQPSQKTSQCRQNMRQARATSTALTMTRISTRQLRAMQARLQRAEMIAEDPTGKLIPHPASGVAGQDWNLQDEMGLRGNGPLYCSIQATVRDLVTTSNIMINQPWPVQDKEVIGQVMKIARECQPYLAQFTHNWATEEIIKSNLKNKRAYVNHQATEEAKDTNGEEMDDNNENGGDDKDSDIEDI